MKGSRYSKRAHMKEDMELQITSMADVFTIILVFLLKSFSTDVTNLSVTENMTLPDGRAPKEVANSLKVQISGTSIVVDDLVAVKLKNFKVADGRTTEKEAYMRLGETLRTEFSKRQAAHKPAATGKAGEEENPRKITILADKKTPFDTVRKVMEASGGEGFTDFDLVVVAEAN